MCGITGFFKLQPNIDHAALVTRMADTLLHRGPDDGGAWADPQVGVALGQRRLSILDLSPQGHQPMFSACGRYVIVFNGEIYNYLDIRTQLEQACAAPASRGTSDTEVMLAAFAHFGVAESLARFNGMFAFALWDRKERTLTLGRDRMGKKPLYYGFSGKAFLFGSELKALRAHPAFGASIDQQSVAQFLRYSYIPGPHTIYEGIFKLPPATSCCWTFEDLQAGRCPAPAKYWDLQAMASHGVSHPFSGTLQDAQDELERLLLDAVRIRMIADVPLGAFFSGGIDSTLVVALMQAQSHRPVRTYTIGFAEAGYDESMFARRIAEHLGTEHTELTATFDQARAVIPTLSHYYDEPFADSSQIPSILVSRLTRQHVTVALSGDGGDEVFGGYNRYIRAPQVYRQLSRVPRPFRPLLRHAERLNPAVLWRCLSLVQRVAPGFFEHREPDLKLAKLLGILSSRDEVDLYHRLTSMHPSPESFCNFEVDPTRDPNFQRVIPEGFSFLQAMQLWDMQTYLPDDILVKVDRATMAASLESRAPLLDYRVIAFAWTLPDAWKVQGGQGKVLLRRLLEKYVPRTLFERPKSGFALPLGTWLSRIEGQSAVETSGANLEQCVNVRLERGKFSDPRRTPHFHWNIHCLRAWCAGFLQDEPG